MLLQRTITALIFISLIIFCVYFLPPVGFDLFAGLIVLVAFWEFSSFFIKQKFTKIVFLIMFLVLVVFAKLLPILPVVIAGVVWWFLAVYLLLDYSKTENRYFKNTVAQFFAGVFIFVPCFIGIVDIHAKFGISFLFYLISVVCATDIGAYFVGKSFGKHLLAPKISPKKTIEGLIGGMFFSLGVGVVWACLNHVVKLGAYNYTLMQNVFILLLTAITCFFSVFGDLFESMLKRQVGLKDSGNILPGHGGMYDRIDSLTSAIPIFSFGLWILTSFL